MEKVLNYAEDDGTQNIFDGPLSIQRRFIYPKGHKRIGIALVLMVRIKTFKSRSTFSLASALMLELKSPIFI